MIKEKELAIKFMRCKAAKIKEFCDIEYFTIEDEKAIVEMDNVRFEKAWIEMVFNINNTWIFGLSSDACIFCYYNHEDCNNCAYGEHHGNCNEESDFRQIISVLRKVGGISSFTFPIHRDLLKSIQEEDDEIL